MHGRADTNPACPVCGAVGSAPFLHRPSVPVHQNLLYDTSADARAVPHGELDLRVCISCQFIFNTAFDPGLLTYGASYENSQDASPTFSAHIDGLVQLLARRPELRGGDVVEVGCGKGVFLRRLLAQPGVDARAVGFDPAYVGPETELDGRLRFERDFYGPATVVAADTVVCRHVVEHVADPVLLLLTAGSTATPERPVRLFVETPCLEWILQHSVPWDFFYEHCSLFTAPSLAFALARAGFGAVDVNPVFGGQYLWAEATTAASEPAQTSSGDAFAALVLAYDAQVSAAVVSRFVRDLISAGPTMVWGAGAKGATFCDLVDPDGSLLAGVVDVNSAKQGRYIAGTGHAIVSPEQAVALGIMTAVVLNPNYTREVASLLAGLGSTARACDLTMEALPCG